MVWAQSFLDPAAGLRLAHQVRPRLLALGRAQDQAPAVPRRPAKTHGLQVPRVVLDLHDRLVVEKPAGWEVDQSRSAPVAP